MLSCFSGSFCFRGFYVVEDGVGYIEGIGVTG